MIYTQKIHTDLQINTLEDLVKLKPFLEDGTLKVNKSPSASLNNLRPNEPPVRRK